MHQQSAIKTAPLQFAAPEAARISTAQSEIRRLVAKLESVCNLRTEIRDIGEKWAAGEIDMLTASAHLKQGSSERDSLARVLRPPIKHAIKRAIASVADLAQKARQHHLDELRKIAAELERGEREQQEAAGMSPDDYIPSVAVTSVQNQYRATLARRNELLNRLEILSLNTAPSLQPATKPATKREKLLVA